MYIILQHYSADSQVQTSAVDMFLKFVCYEFDCLCDVHSEEVCMSCMK
jgi:hypothetical protein